MIDITVPSNASEIEGLEEYLMEQRRKLQEDDYHHQQQDEDDYAEEEANMSFSNIRYVGTSNWCFKVSGMGHLSCSMGYCSIEHRLQM
jgi:hypothetical protein